jgi:ribosomal protein S12 methylthiotransferase accessory factor
VFRKVVQLDPDFDEAHNILGVLLAEMGEYEEALGMIKRAIHLNPDYFDAHNNLALLYKSMGKPKEVIPFFRAYLERNPEEYQRVEQLLKKVNVDLD